MIKDYPSGDGLPGCLKCQGRGVIPAAPRPGSVIVGGRTTPCGCVTERDIIMNVERGWKGLSKASPIPSSPLIGIGKVSLLITATHKVFREHLRHVAVRQGPKWLFSVISDSDMMDSWLARIDDPDVIDADVSQARRQPVTSKYGALVDLVEPPDLLIIVVGVKAARNSAMPEVMLEALQHRIHLNKVTWVVDQPEYRLTTGHISFSDYIGVLIGQWKHVEIGRLKETPQQVHRRNVKPVQVASMDELEIADDDTSSAWMREESDKLANSGKKWGNKKR